MISLEIDYPLEPDYRFFKFLIGGTLQIEGNAGVVNGQIDITARWPDLQIQGNLREGQNIQVGHILQNLGVSVPAAFEKLAIDHLSFSAEPTSEPKTFAFYINIKDVLDLGKFKIESLSLSVDYTGAQTAPQNLPAQLNGRFQGRFQLLGIEFYVSTQRVSAGTGSAWIFEGSADGSNKNIGDLVGDLAKGLSFNTDVPVWLNGLTIKWIDLKYNTHTKDFSFQCDVDAKRLLGEGSDVELIVDVALRCKNPDAAPGVAATYEKTLSGRLLFTLDGGTQLEFDLLFDQASAGTAFIAAYKNLAGGDINIGALAQKVHGPNIPLLINLKDAYFIYDKAANASQANLLFGLDIGGGINLSKLPLVGQLFPDNQSLKIGLRPLIASGALDTQQMYFSAAELGRLQGLIPGGGIVLPNTDIKNPVDLAILLQIGDTVKNFNLPIGLDPNETKSLPAGQTPPAPKSIGDALPPAAGSPAPPQPAPSGGAGDIQWFDLQKSFGPVQFNRIGVTYKDGRIYGYLDASMGLGGLSLSLDGLGVSTPLNKIDPEFSLMGLGIDFQEGPVEIGGSFLRYTVTEGEGAPYDEYDGMAVLKIENFNIAAIGSYARFKGQHSLFLYATLNYPIGGPSFFFVTGLAAGFGYNRALKTPDITQVAQFPLVNEAVNGGGSAPPGDHDGRRKYLQAEITKLRDAIYPYTGKYVLAAGIRFSSFEMIDSFVLLSVNFGQHVDIDILGLSTMVVPTPEPSGKVTPIAELQMALKASINPEEGFLSVEAQLTGNSYLFSRACHLTGGFAFYAWFDGAHKGDFVISLGGYHPAYQAPAHYPKVPRLGFNWKIDDALSLKGEAYFALTAHALMAGGKLEALYEDGGLKAWFVIGADFIISWKPYFYDAHVYLDIGASYTFSSFGTHTVSFELGADLHIWGPDFSGKATIHYYIVSFTVSFGDAASRPRPLDWYTFRTSFLPEPAKVVSATIAGGLTKEDGDRHFINAKELVLSVQSLVPVKTYQLGLSEGFAKDKNDRVYYADSGKNILLSISDTTPDKAVAASTGDFGIGPMDVTLVSGSEMKIEIKEDEKEGSVNADFTFTPILKRMPKAMWGGQLVAETNGEQFVENALAGFEIRPANPAKPGETHPVLKKALQYEIDANENAYNYPQVMSIGALIQEPADLSNIFSVADARKALLEELGYKTDALNLSVPPEIRDSQYFVTKPQGYGLTYRRSQQKSMDF